MYFQLLKMPKKKKKKSQFNFFKDTIKVLPIAYLGLLAYSALGLHFYYGFFSIPIFSFISLEELLTNSISDITSMAIMLFAVLVLSYLFELTIRVLLALFLILKRFKGIIKGTVEPDDFNFGDYQISSTSLFIWSVILLIFFFNIGSISPFLRWTGIIVNFILLLIIPSIHGKINVSSKYLVIFYIAIIYQFQIVYKSIKAKAIYEEGDSLEVQLNSNGSLIKTDNTISYIGKTKDYVFLFNRVKNETKILKIQDVDDFSILKKIR